MGGARSKAAAARTSFQARVRASHQPPRNQAQFTFVSGSATAAAKLASSHGWSFGPEADRTKPWGAARTDCSPLSRARKFFELKEKTASTGASLLFVKRYSSAQTGRLALFASPASKGLQPVSSTASGSRSSESAMEAKGKRASNVAARKRGRP